jgi:hypothetical protein
MSVKRPLAYTNSGAVIFTSVNKRYIWTSLLFQCYLISQIQGYQQENKIRPPP